jgi:dipeptidyl aminopeptidase/acylaminoacyl peptidase
VVRENLGETAPARTYQDLLQNPFDEILFEYYMTSQVMEITLDGGSKPLGDAAIISTVAPSPNGEYLLVETIHRPFSYLVPGSRFPTRIDVWDRDGAVVHQVADLPLAENVPIGRDAARTGPRSVDWRADEPATLFWVEAQDEGDPGVEADVRDSLYLQAAPFDDRPVNFVSVDLRYSDIRWGEESMAMVSARWWSTRQSRTWVVNPDNPGTEPRLLFDYSYEDRYKDPGAPLMRTTETGSRVLLTADDGGSIFMAGEGASPEGNRPFLDKLVLETGQTERLWRSDPPYYEDLVRLTDAGGTAITRRESRTVPPNYFVRELGTGDLRQLTDFPNPNPQFADVEKELIRYKRADGVMLSGTLYTPPGWRPDDGPLPMLMWAYPREFKSAAAAGQVTRSPYRFTRVGWSSALPWLLVGYAVFDGPTMPIIGEGDQEPNDTYVEQLVASAKAAVEEVVRRGVADRDKIAIGGHSYGAFMTANLLAHSDLFRAGIARSGAYNRTLTPFGFQAEQRTFWEAPNIYFRMSPFMHADRVNEPILLIHGEADNNSGTFPVQSRRFYAALKGHGATVRLVMLPHESHGYRARDSVMHTMWEMTEWLDRYVKEEHCRNMPRLIRAAVVGRRTSYSVRSAGGSVLPGTAGAFLNQREAERTRSGRAQEELHPSRFPSRFH